jgi:hypothetical protein
VYLLLDSASYSTDIAQALFIQQISYLGFVHVFTTRFSAHFFVRTGTYGVSNRRTRLIRPEQAPEPIFGGPNLSNRRFADNPGRLEVLEDALKTHDPLRPP